MFNKTTSSTTPQRRPTDTLSTATTTEPSPASRRPPAPRAASLLGPDLVIEGSIAGEGELHIEGVVRGEVQVARLVIGENARIEGMVRGAQVEVRGKVIGNIEARQVKLYESAHVEGDITHEQLSIDVGAYFQGRCQQFQRPAQPAPQIAQVIELDKAQG